MSLFKRDRPPDYEQTYQTGALYLTLYLSECERGHFECAANVISSAADAIGVPNLGGLAFAILNSLEAHRVPGSEVKFDGPEEATNERLLAFYAACVEHRMADATRMWREFDGDTVGALFGAVTHQLCEQGA